MSDVIETIKNILSESELLDDFNGKHIDYMEDSTETCGLYSNGSVKLREDILGNAVYQHSFVLYAAMDTIEDFNRLQNSSFLLNLTYWLDAIKNVPITATVGSQEKNGMILSVRAANAMMFSPIAEDFNNGVQYQLQINVTYKIMGE